MKYWDKSITLIEGCTPVSPACDHCWSAAMAHRFHRDKGLTTNGHFSGKIICRPDRLGEILKRKKSTRWIIWNDLFHPSVPFEFINRVFDITEQCPQHKFQILTKRPERALSYFEEYSRNIEAGISEFFIANNVWLGVTVENNENLERINVLDKISAAKKFVSFEPLLEAPLALYGRGIRDWLDCVDWVIIGCESGPHRRPCKLEWVRDLVRQCKSAGVKVFVKQIPINGKVVRDIEKFPKDLQIRQFPLDKW